jgi:hypothetical protein
MRGAHPDEIKAMNMSDEHRENPAPQPQPYAEEVLCASWNPVVLLLAEPLAHASKPAANDRGDVESLLARVYLWQQA